MFVVSCLLRRLCHHNICWRDSTAEQKQASTFLECIDGYFPAQMAEELLKVDAVLYLVLTKVKDRLGISLLQNVLAMR